MKLLLVDATGYLFRAFFASGDFRSADGHPTGALLLFVNMLRKLRKETGADYEACIMDASGKTFRHDIYPEYKANRPQINPDLKSQIEPSKEFVHALGCPLICHSGVEADDVIATLARQGASAGMDVIVASGDKDLMQIVDSKIKLYDGMKSKFFDENAVLEKYGVNPSQISDYLALCGDSSDNIKGVNKVGPKTAMKLLASYGNLDKIIESVDSLPGAIGENIKTAIADNSLSLSRELTKIKYDVELPVTVNDLKPKSPDLVKWENLCAKFQFTKLAKALNDVPKSKSVNLSQRSNFITISSIDDLKYHIKNAINSNVVAIDTETFGAPVMEAKIVGFSFCYEPTNAYYVPLSHNDITATQISYSDALDALKPLLESKVRKIFHNGKYDLHIFANYGMDVSGVIDDTKIAAAIMEPAKPNSLSDLSKLYLNINATSFGDLFDKKADKNFSNIDVETATKYAAEDSEVTLKLDSPVIDRLEGKFKKIYEVIDRPFMGVLFRMERHGVFVDKDKLKDLSHEWQKKIIEFENQAFEMVGERFNLNSPDQVANILFEKLKAPSVKKTDTGADSTDEGTLKVLAPDYPLANILLQHRSLAKLKGTYSDGLLRMIHPETGRVHTSYNQTYVNTRRLSSKNPNLQNIPIKTADGRRIREAFVADSDSLIISADYSQIELRLMAHIAKDEALIKAFNSGADVHKITASEVFDVP